MLSVMILHQNKCLASISISPKETSMEKWRYYGSTRPCTSRFRIRIHDALTFGFPLSTIVSSLFSSEPRRFFIPVNVSLDMLTMERRGSQPAPSSHPPGHGRTKSVGQGMGMGMGMGGVPMSPGGSGSPVVGAEVEWADSQARYVVPVSS